jgi:8-oxo-dGTP diphosphatase
MNKLPLPVTCAIIVEAKKVLVTQRGEQMLLPLKWEFPGGKIREDETEEECIAREISEELNIEIDILEKLNNSAHDYGSAIINLIPFVCSPKSIDFELVEHQDAKWCSKEDLFNLDCAPADIPILNQLLLTNYV